MKNTATTLLSLSLLTGCFSTGGDGSDSDLPIWTSARYLGDLPSAAETYWSAEVQGIAHDDDDWFIADRWSVYRFRAGEDLTSDRFEAGVFVPSPCDHIGDIDHAQGKVYLPLEGCGLEAPLRICALDAETLAVDRCGVVPMSAQPLLSWLAVDVARGVIWSSDFDADHLNAYALDFEDGEMLELVEVVPLDRRVLRVQGGQISASGRLYLASDDRMKSGDAGIHVLDLTGDTASHVSFIPAGVELGKGSLEMQGVTLWDRGDEGQIHWLLLNNDLGHDNAGIRHVKVDRPDDI
jgi:hypothetical protein